MSFVRLSELREVIHRLSEISSVTSTVASYLALHVPLALTPQPLSLCQPPPPKLGVPGSTCPQSARAGTD